MALKGIDVILYDIEQTGTDAFNHPVYTETPIMVSNVLVAPASSEAIAEELTISGKRLEYLLCIPKGDEHTWEDRTVEFFGTRWKTFGYPQEWIESMVPLAWNKQVKVERYG